MRKLYLLRISKIVKFITEESFLQHGNITINKIKNGLINHLIKIENYIQQSEGASLIKHGSFIDLASCATE
jgi:hypothetical protein